MMPKARCTQFGERNERPQAPSAADPSPKDQQGNADGSNQPPTSDNEARPASSQLEDRPRILAQNIDLALVTPQAWDVVSSRNVPRSLFQYGALPARIEHDDDGRPRIRVLSVDRMRHRLARDIDWYKVTKDGGPVPTPPPLAVVRDMLACPHTPLPILTRIVKAPIFAANGCLETQVGYSAASKTFFAPSAGFSIPAVSPSPSCAEIKKASELLTRDLLGEFPFVGPSEKAHTIAALMCPFARELIQGPTPLHSFEAPTPGTGKTLLVTAITLPALGLTLNALTEARDEDEWRKRLFAKLLSSSDVVLIDNVRRRVDSAALASVLTAFPQWEDRFLGKSEIIAVPVRCTWIMTANNPTFSCEITRRTVRIRLDAKRDQPWLRSDFKRPRLLEWAMEHRSELTWAALTLIQAWIAAGRPSGKQTLGMFEEWAKVMGGILNVAGIPGFLGNLNEFYQTADAEGATWRSFVAAWWSVRGSLWSKVGELYALAVECEMLLGEKSEQSQKVRLGQKLNEARDRVFAIEADGQVRLNLRIEKGDTHNRATLWRLDRYESYESL
jgi:hypothetical protein